MPVTTIMNENDTSTGLKAMFWFAVHSPSTTEHSILYAKYSI